MDDKNEKKIIHQFDLFGGFTEMTDEDESIIKHHPDSDQDNHEKTIDPVLYDDLDEDEIPNDNTSTPERTTHLTAANDEITAEKVDDLFTEYADDNYREYQDQDQLKLFEVEEKWQEHWKEMPEFIQQNLEPFKTVLLHFRSTDDMRKFSELIGQKITLATKWMWYPESETMNYKNKRWIDQNDERLKND